MESTKWLSVKVLACRSVDHKVKLQIPDGSIIESQAKEVKVISKKTIGLIMMIIIPIFLFVIVFALMLLAELDLDLLTELGLGKDQVPRLEDYDLENAAHSEFWTGDPDTDANAVHMYSIYRLMLHGSTRANPVVSIVAYVIKNHKGEKGPPLVLNNQIYHIQSIHGDIKCAIKKGHVGDGVFYHDDKFRKYNTGIIIPEPQ